MKKVNTYTAEETCQWGQKIGSLLKQNSIVALFGDLGAGKTTLIKGIATSTAEIDPRDVSSPTFTYLNIYSGLKNIYHFDLYRLNREEDFLALGFDEYFEAGGVCCIEWPEKIHLLLPDHVIKIELHYTSATSRQLILPENFAWI